MEKHATLQPDYTTYHQVPHSSVPNLPVIFFPRLLFLLVLCLILFSSGFFFGMQSGQKKSLNISQQNYPSPTIPVACPQVITQAKNLQTGICKSFPNPCVVPSGWIPTLCAKQ